MIQNFIAKLSAKEKKIFYVAIIFVVAAFLDRLFLGPAMSKLKSLDEEIENQENLIKRDLRFLSYKSKILQENEKFSPYYAAKTQTEEEIIATFLKKVEMLASESKVNLIKVNPSEVQQKKGFIEYYANLECDGTLENITKFVYAVDTSPDLLRVVKLGMNPKKAGSEEISATIIITKIIVDASAIEEAKKIKEGDAEGEDFTAEKKNEEVAGTTQSSFVKEGELKSSSLKDEAGKGNIVDEKIEVSNDAL